MTQTADEFFAQVNGTLETITLACGMLFAAHPHREKLLSVLNTLGTVHAAAAENDTPQEAAYKTGIRKTVDTLQKSIDTGNQAAELSAAKSTGQVQ
ncbi:hypothetical protein IEQ11_16025 [Lysobacter capsici]|uniref:hypothetical protein n=1 Tax=Lysobacter capsici TaxID=435897 RepID=UPI00177B329F|nr:hypothetical protein [Lysobacter capsici]UOF13251.1 hypothetical protein IEQ11_16025 [Lysobacter capsici]